MESLLSKGTSKLKSKISSLSILALILFFIMVFIMGLLKIYSPDLGFHLKSAEWMLGNRQFIYADSFSYGSEGHKYFDLQWLYQLLVYSLYNISEKTLIIANALLITISFILVWFRFLKKAQVEKTSIKVGFFAFMAIVFVQPFAFEIRPYVLSGIFLNLTLFFLESYKAGNKKALFFLPVITLIWVNTHSLAILGLVTLAIYNAGIYLEKGKVDKTLLLYSGVSFTTFFVNPYLIEGLFYSLSQFGIISGNSLFKSYLGELQSPFTAREIEILGARYFASPLLIIHLSAVLSVFTIFRATIQKQFTDALLLTAYLVLLYLAHRNYGIFILVSLPLFVKYTLNWFDSKKLKTLKQKKTVITKKENKTQEGLSLASDNLTNQKFYSRFSFAAIVLAIFISITSITNGYPIFRHSPYRFGSTTDKDQLPVEATAFLNHSKIKGKLLNHLDFGGYLMAHYSETVFIDGRMDLFEEDFFRKYYESLTVRNGIKVLLNKHNPDIVIFPYVKASYWWDYFLSQKKQSGYKAVYFDGLSVVYLKTATYPQFPELTEKDILSVLDPGAVKRINVCIETSKPKGLMTLVNGLWQKQSFSIADQNKATYCFTNGFNTAALNYSVMGIESSTIHTPNIFKNLSIYFQEKKMYNEFQVCDSKSE
jgi:hypothetical protein